MRIAYLYSRYPVLSQTFCDTEMLELERRGFPLLIGSIHPPLTSIRHAHAARLQARIHYAPPSPILRVWEDKMKADLRWPGELVGAHEKKYGPTFKAALRARNACYFADLFTRAGIQHFHVHFANRAAHTALFLKEISGLPFSITAHGQDFMSDLGNDELLREICAAAEFVAVETDFSRGLLSARCPESAAKIQRVYNGMELQNFPPVGAIEVVPGPPRILSIGRLVPFKGFDVLVDACAELHRSGVSFVCEIIGDGPLRDPLQTRIAEHGLTGVVRLSGALPQQTVFEKLRACDVFALASTIDEAGASDVFPTVILEAMASSRPVVSTSVAGIPESVAHGLTGLLVPPGDSSAFAKALERLITDQWLRVTFGAAGRTRVEQYFQVEATIAPLMGLFAKLADGNGDAPAPNRHVRPTATIAYLIDRWPDPELPLLEAELIALGQQELPVSAYVCDVPAGARISSKMKELATRLVFVPDASVIEAEWQANRALGYQLEDARANEKHRAAPAIFLHQARYAVTLRGMLNETGIRHVHATSSRMLLCALMLKNLLGVKVTAAIEARPALPRPVIAEALGHCDGGRVGDRKLQAKLGDSFMFDRTACGSVFGGVVRNAGGAKVLQDWTDMLVRWR